MLRGWERLKWRLRERRKGEGTPEAVTEARQPARISWRGRAFYLSYWSDRGEEKEVLLGGLMRFLTPQKYFIVTDQGWNDWDIKISRGLWSRALVLVCTENHGGMKRLLQVRCAMRLSRFSAVALRAYAAATAAALILDAPAAATAIGLLGIAQGALIAYRTVEFSKLMHGIIETVAKHAELTPVTPPGDAATPIEAPRAA
jgi:hypothetical protein